MDFLQIVICFQIFVKQLVNCLPLCLLQLISLNKHLLHNPTVLPFAESIPLQHPTLGINLFCAYFRKNISNLAIYLCLLKNFIF